MERTPSISVIVPMYKVEKYIKLCVDSILAQTFQDFEIILVNDASPDNCFELCRKLYGDNEKVKLIRHEKNLGLGESRNTGINHAVGKYVYFVDSDDFISPVTLEKFYTAAEKNNAEVVQAGGWYELTQDEPEPIGKENLQIRRLEHYQEGFLQNNPRYRLEEYWEKDSAWSMAWLRFCRRDFLEKNQIRFLPIISEDEPFSFALFCTAERYYILRDAFYIYRIHSDSIMRSYNTERLSKGIIEAIFRRYSNNHVYPFYVNDKIAAANETVENVLTPAFGELMPFVKYFFNQAHLYRRQAELLLLTINKLNNQYSSQVMTVFNRLELSNNKIVFVNFMGRGYGCNPKYIAEEIIRQNLPYDLVWLVNDMNAPMPYKIRKVKYGGINSMYELATAKVIVSNTKNLLPFPSKKYGQYFIMIWHGGQGFKLVERDAGEKLSPAYVATSKANSAITDLMVVNTQEQFDEFRRAFWYSGEILKCGLPRNDIFFRRDEKLIARIRQRLNIPPTNKIVMYAPTFRDNPEVTAEVCRFDTRRLLNVMCRRFGGDWTLLVRHHPNVAPHFSKNSFGDNVVNVTNYPDMQELILISDVLISDYSSVICDFMFTNKPVFIYAKDFDSYTKERGFKPLYFDLPYKINRSEAELFSDIETFDVDALAPKIKRFIDTVKPFDDGHASEQVVKKIKVAVNIS